MIAVILRILAAICFAFLVLGISIGPLALLPLGLFFLTVSLLFAGDIHLIDVGVK